MQPYFFPYAGYFRLLAVADVFVFLDDVQFPRSGWVHRNKFEYKNSKTEWLTLPIVRSDRDSTQIRDLKYRFEDEHQFLEKFSSTKYLSEIPENLINFDNNVVDDLVGQIKYVTEELGFSPTFRRSSEYPEFLSLTGQEKIIAICKNLGAKKYLNLSGGKTYYSEKDFEENNIELEILAPHEGRTISIIDSIHAEGVNSVRLEIRKNLIIDR